MQQSEENHYTILRIGRKASSEQVRKAYFHAARQMHPDTNPDPDAAEQFIRLQQAYETLADPTKRAAYDLTLGEEEPVDAGISVNAIYSRKSLVSINEPQLVYVLLEVLSTAKPGEGLTVPLNLCLVIDRSTSMGGPRLDMVKANALNLVRQMKSDSFISVVSFSDYAERVVPAMRLSDIGKIEAGIRLMNASGATEIFRGLEAGIAEVKRNFNLRYINHLILITDGHTYGDESACFELAQKAAAEGIGISCLGIGSEWNDAFVDKLVSYSGGNSLYVDNPGDLDHFLSEKFNNLTNIYVENVTFDYDSDDEVSLRYAFRLQPEKMPINIEGALCLGNILSSSGSTRPESAGLSIVLEFLVRPMSKRTSEITLAYGKLKMNMPSRQPPASAVTLQLVRPVSDQASENTPNTAILQALSQVTLYRMQEKARNEVMAGEIRKATGHLQNLATHLLAMGERDLARTVLIEAEHLNKKQEFTQEGNKKIKYGTRGLYLLPEGAPIKA
jgi:Ca-activated chloride channel family protein